MSPTFLLLVCVLVCGGVFVTDARTPHSYLGCYLRAPKYDGPNTTSKKMDPNFCLNFCRSKAYPYAVVDGNKCFCAKKISTAKAKSVSDCNTLCSGNPTRICGGKTTVSVFKTGIAPNKESEKKSK